MIGTLAGAFIAFLCCILGDASWWWLLWASLLGFAGEVSVRCGCGEEFVDALYCILIILSCFGDD